MARLHRNAAIRCLRSEIERLNDARLQLCEVLDDPRSKAAMIEQQMDQCDVEMEELFDAIAVLMKAAEPVQIALEFEAPNVLMAAPGPMFRLPR